MTQNFDQLFQAYEQLVTKQQNTATLVGSVWSSFVLSADQRKDFVGRVAQIGQYIKALDPDTGVKGKALLSGELSPARYVEIIQIYWNELADIQQRAGSEGATFERVWGEIVVPSALEVKADVNAARAGLPSAPVAVGIVLLILVLVLAIKVT